MRGYEPDLYKDLPLAYAIYRIILNDEGSRVVNMQCSFVNDYYCEMVGKEREELIGQLFLDIFPKDDSPWFSYCYRAGVLGDRIQDTVFSEELNHWIDVSIASAQRPGYVAYTFSYGDHRHRERASLIRKNLTVDACLSISKILSSDEEYNFSIQHALTELSSYVYADRIYIIEIDKIKASISFEWCNEGIASEIDLLQNKSCDTYIMGWEALLTGEGSCVLIKDVEELKEAAPLDYKRLKLRGIRRLIAAPIYQREELIGYLAADNYAADELIDIREMLETISYFLSAKIANQRLIKELKHLGFHDELTGLKNRYSLRQRITELKKRHDYVGLIYADINGLKQMNDSFGHEAGDHLLCRSAELIANYTGREYVYREGGDEFVAMLPGISRDSFDALLDKLKLAILREADLSIAIGGEWIEDSADIEQAICSADQRMYIDKLAYYQSLRL